MHRATLQHDFQKHPIDLHSMIIQNGVKALIMASIGGHASLMTLLLDAKADVNQVEQVNLKFLVVLCSGYSLPMRGLRYSSCR